MLKNWQKYLGMAIGAGFAISFPPIIVLFAVFLFWQQSKKKSVSFFSNKVARKMFNAGYSVEDMPPNHIFKPVCDALKENGYDADLVAELWLKHLQDNDKEAFKELTNNSGIYGQLLQK